MAIYDSTARNCTLSWRYSAEARRTHHFWNCFVRMQFEAIDDFDSANVLEILDSECCWFVTQSLLSFEDVIDLLKVFSNDCNIVAFEADFTGHVGQNSFADDFVQLIEVCSSNKLFECLKKLDLQLDVLGPESVKNLMQHRRAIQKHVDCLFSVNCQQVYCCCKHRASESVNIWNYQLW